MGIETLLLGVLAGTSIAAGQAKGRAALQESHAITAEAEIEKADALAQADLAREQGEKVLAQQALGFTASGVKLTGSPLDVLESTQASITSEFTQRLARAERVRDLRGTQAARARTSGQVAELGGFVQAGQLALKAFNT